MSTRSFLPAVVGPWAALVIARDFGDKITVKAAALRAAGQVEAADQLLVAVASMREAGRQRMAAHRHTQSEVDGQAGIGRSEVPIAGGSSESSRLLGSGMTTREVATQLRVSSRQVLNLRGTRLVATWSKGRWLFDEVSVAEELERRRNR